MSAGTVVALVLAFASTTLINLAYLRQHDAVGALPALSLRRPLHSARLLLTDRAWLVGFAMETGGFVLYAVALALASLALVQSISAGGIGILAVVSARMTGRRLTRREVGGVLLSLAGLLALAVSLSGGSSADGRGAIVPIVLWLGLSAVAGAVAITAGRRVFGAAAAGGVAGGIFFSIGDIATKVTTEGGARSAFVVVLVAGYLLGTSLIQVGYQAGGALTVAGPATLLTNALPIAAGTIVLDEPVPPGALGALRVLAFAAVTVGALLLARAPGPDGRPSGAGGGVGAGDRRPAMP